MDNEPYRPIRAQWPQRPPIGPDKRSEVSVHSARHEGPGALGLSWTGLGFLSVCLRASRTPCTAHLLVFSLLLSARLRSRRFSGAFSHKAFNYHINPAHSNRPAAAATAVAVAAEAEGNMCTGLDAPLKCPQDAYRTFGPILGKWRDLGLKRNLTSMHGQHI